MPLLIAIVGTLLIWFQNADALLAFTWALIHGAGVAALAAFVPAVLGCVLLWIGYAVLTPRLVRRVPSLSPIPRPNAIPPARAATG